LRQHPFINNIIALFIVFYFHFIIFIFCISIDEQLTSLHSIGGSFYFQIMVYDIGIRRETKNKWERRCPLNPKDCQYLIQSGLSIAIQPSKNRVYSDAEFQACGVVLTDDLTQSRVILAVKEVPVELLIPNKSYAFFAHVLKAQSQNLPLLDALLDKKIRLYDYEAITEGGVRGGKRKLAFGRYAGIAGAVDALSILGKRLLALGFATPFLSIAEMYHYRDIDHAMKAVAEAGDLISKHGLPPEVCPFNVCITGDGNVGKGALEVYKQLPFVQVDPFELQNIVTNGDPSSLRNTIVLAVAKEQHMVRLRRSSDHVSSPVVDTKEHVDVMHYKSNPDAYDPIFHTTILPFVSVLMHCSYWDQRFPRLVTIKQIQSLANCNQLRLIGVGDISCDFHGAIEFLHQFTTIDDPAFMYNPKTDELTPSTLNGEGIFYHAVDHLPSECPKDASDHFSSILAPLVPHMVRASSSPFDDLKATLPSEILGSLITDNGTLTPQFSYIHHLREAAEKSAASKNISRLVRNDASFATFNLTGHVFDTSLLNKVLDAVELKKSIVSILDIAVGKTRHDPTQVTLQLLAPDASTSSILMSDINALAQSHGAVVSLASPDSYLNSVDESHEDIYSTPKSKLVEVNSKSILVLGAGLVSAPLVTQLLKRENYVTLIDSRISELQRIAKGKPRVKPLQLDITSQLSTVGTLISNHDHVISLLPAHMHPVIAKLAIQCKKDMTTASYISPEIASLDEEAKAAGISIAMEFGLDPGIDALCISAMVHEAQRNGETVVGLRSYCGGLPAPEVAPPALAYKFSWSPRGALAAAKNAAKFLQSNQTIEVPSKYLLLSSSSFHLNPAFALECVPNRDSIPYAEKFGVNSPDLATMFRGTLRYVGFSRYLHALENLKLLSVTPVDHVFKKPLSMRELLYWCCDIENGEATLMNDEQLLDAVVNVVHRRCTEDWNSFLADLSSHSSENFKQLLTSNAHVLTNIDLYSDSAKRLAFKDFIRWLGLLSADVEAPLVFQGALFVPLDTLVEILTKIPEMNYAAGERDLVLIRNELEVISADGKRKCYREDLIEYGDETTGETAMSRTVGITAAICAQQKLDEIEVPCGILSPSKWPYPELTLRELAKEGIKLKRSVQTLL
jgi:alpha-aminoadipic semialdehyde synthase